MTKKNKADDPFAILDDPPGSWRPVRTLAFTLIGLVVLMMIMLHDGVQLPQAPTGVGY
jgi:hypothetical protein